MGAVEKVVTIFAIVGVICWTLTLFFIKNKQPRNSFNIIKLHVVANIICLLIFVWILVLIKDNLQTIDPSYFDLIAIINHFVSNQAIFTVILCNLYAIFFQYRSISIDPNLPLWLTSILCFICPLTGTVFILLMDKLLFPYLGGVDLFEVLSGKFQTKIP